MPKIITPDSFEHWLQLRSEDISSTESAALFGMSPYSTPYEVYYQKKAFRDTGEIFTLEDNERMMIGRNVEDAIAKMFMEKYGVNASPFKDYARHSDDINTGSSFDYTITDGPDRITIDGVTYPLKGNGLLEIKNVDYFIYKKEWSEDEAPPHIEIQVQHQLEVIDREWAIICPLVGGNQLKPIFRERDRAVGEAIKARVKKFWSDMDAGMEPAPDYEKDADLIIKLYSDDDGEVMDITDDDGLQALVMAYDELRSKYNDLEKATKTIKAEVIDRVKNASALTTDWGLRLNLSRTKDSPPKTITEDMVGQEIGGRKGYRQFRITRKGKKA